ncbi:hypothetical protein DH2020_002170 [Rehmannia glutinosa]|uniref:DUF4378 domain-containing protein n=1 Tax=Rehmannia glutinosa TaxID=99300 RepID=A0ABR0XTP0_REHGL
MVDPLNDCLLIEGERANKLLDTEESKMPMADVAKTSVKELMEEEMTNEQGSKHPDDSEIEQVNSKTGNRMKRRQKKKRSSIKSTDMDAVELDAAMPGNFDQVPEQKPWDNLDLERILEELARINQRNTNCLKHNFDVDSDIPSGEDVTIVEEKLVQAVKLFIEQKLSNSKRFGEEGNNCCLKELMDNLQTLSLNKGLFLKLLKDPNTELVKHIQNLEDARLGKDQTANCLPVSEEKPVNLKSDELSSHKHRNFFRRRSKSLESYPLGGDNKDCPSPNKIVILKPGPAGSRSPETDTDSKLHNERNTSQFSFTEIKRKLRHAMGKERQGIFRDKLILKSSPKPQNGSNGDKGENLGWRSPNRNHFYTERFTSSSPSFKKGEPVNKLKDDGSEVVNEPSQYPRLGGSNIYIEAKKHLSEMVKSGDENPESISGQLAKPLGRILSLPEYNASPCLSPRKHGDDIFITAQMRLSPRGMIKNNVSGLLLEDKSNHPIESIVAETERTIESRPQEEGKIIDISSESSSSSTGGDIQNGDTREVDNEESASPCFKSVNFHPLILVKQLSGEDQILSSPTVSPSHNQASKEIEDSDRAIDKIEQPSPISVLEPLFTDDDISPASTISHPVEKEIQPRHIHFEEQSFANDPGVCTRISLEDEESAFEYVEAVLLGSGLNWDEFLLRWLSLYDILDSSLFDEVELFSSRPRHDQKLLFDCANEALKEVCECYFGCFTDISRVKPNMRPVPKGMDLIHEVWRRVERLICEHPQPHSLDQLVKRDLAESKNWMNIQLDIEVIVFEMGEVIFDLINGGNCTEL